MWFHIRPLPNSHWLGKVHVPACQGLAARAREGGVPLASRKWGAHVTRGFQYTNQEGLRFWLGGCCIDEAGVWGTLARMTLGASIQLLQEGCLNWADLLLLVVQALSSNPCFSFFFLFPFFPFLEGISMRTRILGWDWCRPGGLGTHPH